ncbi:hypothetical protein BJX63DRAFT_431085 [Aspergillus granulosus]|uniref:Cupin type-1 domain-containing protein n=1 Tax=Aspergillus granulosus TaxID=176169 RepID=A0ABR4HHM1_9EURO
MSAPTVTLETYTLPATPTVPNSRLPIIVYRSVLYDTTPLNILNTIEPNGWLKGGQWKTYKIPHFHTRCHECYAIIRGGSTYQLGVGPNDLQVDEEGRKLGMELTVQAGDVFVLPVFLPFTFCLHFGDVEEQGEVVDANAKQAGICHASVDSWGDYEFVGLYPNGILHTNHRFDMNYGLKHPSETPKLREEADAVPIPPLDPVYGLDGPLPRLWRKAAKDDLGAKL